MLKFPDPNSSSAFHSRELTSEASSATENQSEESNRTRWQSNVISLDKLLPVVKIKDKVNRKKFLASIAKFLNINQQLESKKDHPHLITPPNHCQIQSIPPVAALPHDLTGDKRKDQRKRKEGRNHYVSAKFQKQLFLFWKSWTTKRAVKMQFYDNGSAISFVSWSRGRLAVKDRMWKILIQNREPVSTKIQQQKRLPPILPKHELWER